MPNPKTKLKKYSVLLLYPDYIPNAYGEGSYFTHVEAFNPTEAVTKARNEAASGNVLDEPSDFTVLLVIEGHHDDIKP